MGKRGRKPFDFSKYVVTTNQTHHKCKHCGHQFVGNGTRVKAHLHGIPGKGVEVCPSAEQLLQEFDGFKEGTKSTERGRVKDSNKRTRRSTKKASISNSNKRAKTIAIASEQDLPGWGFPINQYTLNEDKVDKETIEGFPCQLVSQKKETKEKEVSSFNQAKKLHCQVCPFSVSHRVEADDQKLIKYVFSLKPSEEVVSIGNCHLKQSEFTTLRPCTWLDALVIDIVVESLTIAERKKQKKFLNWYLPISFSTSALGDEGNFKDFVERNIRRTYMSELANCEKMFIPIHADDHFYLYVVDIKKKEVRIWDSLRGLPSTVIEKREEKGKNILLALDSLFAIDIDNGSKGWKFVEFDVKMAEDILYQPNGFDCGIFVIKFMKLAADMTNLNTEFQSDEERLTLALSLLKDDRNKHKGRLFQESKKLHQQDFEDRHIDNGLAYPWPSIPKEPELQEIQGLFQDSKKLYRQDDEDEQHVDNCVGNALLSVPEEPELQGIGDLSCCLKTWESLSSKENYTRGRSEEAGLDQKFFKQMNNMQEEAKSEFEGSNWSMGELLESLNSPKIQADLWELLEQTSDTGLAPGNQESNIDPLKIEEIKSIDANLEWRQHFIHTAFFPEDRKISREELIRYFVDEGLINGMMSLEAQFDGGHTILDALEKQGLLEGGSFDMEEQDTDDEYDQDDIWLKGGIVDPEVKWVKISGDSRAKATSMINKNSGFMVEAGSGLTEIPYERKWSSMKKVSLMCNSIKKIPWGNSLKCAELSTLILQQNPLEEISDNFFSDMPALRVLDLSYTNIKKLPDSVSDLESLNSLLLKSCQCLEIVPPLGELKHLRRLDLSQTVITTVPKGLGRLVNLMWLSFFKCEKLDMKTERLIPKLTNLRYLVLDLNIHRFMKVSAKDLADLNKLETFAGNLCSPSDFNAYVKSIQDKERRPKNYLLQLGSGNPWDPTFGRAVIFINCDILTGEEILQLPVDVEQLYIVQCMRWQCVCDDLSSNSTTSLKYIYIFECDRLENFCCSDNKCTFCSSLRSLESLHLVWLPDLRFLWGEIDPPFFTLPRLRHLEITDCASIRKLLTHQMLEKLPNLEKIHVEACNSMEEIFSVTGRKEMGETSSGGNSLPPTFFFPKLVSLKVLNLPRLTSVCGGKMKFTCLQKFIIKDCPKLISKPDIEAPVGIDLIV